MKKTPTQPAAAAPTRLDPSPSGIRGLDPRHAWDYENGFYWFSDPSRLNKVFAHYELYKSILGLPGHVFELGVYKAASLIRLATFRQTLEGDHSRKIVGFDAFGRFPTAKVSLPEDLSMIHDFEGAGGEGLSTDEVGAILEAKSFRNIALVKGNVFDTLPAYLQQNPETRLALLHLDMDVKEPTVFALEELYPRVVPGGLIVLDDYNGVVGATEAVDDFVAKHRLRLEKLNFNKAPTFVRKPQW
jgi:hypothetical protein